MSGWSVFKRYKTRDRTKLTLIDPNLQVIPLNPKMRYLYVSAPKREKRKLLEQINLFKKPYPKRETDNILPMKIALLKNSYNKQNECYA